MKIATKLIALCLVVSAIVCGVYFIKASAKSLDQTQLDYISANCVSLKNNLNQLHISDALLRVNMGQRYELVSTKLMDRFNNRISSNSFKIDNLNDISLSYKSTLDNFRSDYITYEQSLSSAIKINCATQPELFYNSVQSVRSNRNKVYEDTKKLVQQIEDYRLEVLNFEKFFRSIGAR